MQWRERAAGGGAGEGRDIKHSHPNASETIKFAMCKQYNWRKENIH